MAGTRKKATATLRRPRRPGRPGGATHTDAVRAELLRAARELFAERDFRAVSVRDIARAAHVNPAMVHYHFGDKQGLYRAMLDDALGPVLQRFQHAIADPSGAEGEVRVAQVLRMVMTIMAREPWVPRLVVREVLADDGPFRDMFIREFASRGAGRVPALIEREIACGGLRPDLDATLGALSLLSLALFPFFALPIAQKVFGIRMTDEFVVRLIEHTARLYCEGAAPRPEKRQRSSIRRSASRRMIT
jgi:TetR/AcrR family transcriptional regulator